MRIGPKLAIALLLGCLLTLGVAACGGGGNGSGSSANSSDGTSDISGTVTVWDFEYESFPAYTELVDKLNAEFEKEHPGVTVDWVAQPYESYEATYRAAFTAREGPDVMTMQPGESGVLSFDQGLEVLDDRITPDLEDHLTQWQSVTPGLKREGERFGLPTGVQGWVFYYNKKMFKEAGLPTDFQPNTWAEVREAGEKLKEAGFQPFTGGNKEGLENSFWFSVGYQSQNSEDQITELAEGDIPYTDDAVKRGLEPLSEMVEAGLFPKDFFTTPWVPDGPARFEEEKGAMILGNWAILGYWGDYNEALGEKNVGMFFPPSETPAAGTFGGVVLSMPKFAKNKDAAWALLEFYVSKHAGELLYSVAGVLPVRDDVQLPPDAPEQAVRLVEASREPSAVVAPFAAMKSNIAFLTLPTEISQVLQGRTPLEDALNSIQETNEKSGAE